MEKGSDREDSLANLYVEAHLHKRAVRTKSLDCLVCGLSATTSSQLHKHMTEFHVGADPYECSTCDS